MLTINDINFNVRLHTLETCLTATSSYKTKTCSRGIERITDQSPEHIEMLTRKLETKCIEHFEKLILRGRV